MPGVGIGVILINEENKILLIKRNDNSLLAFSAMHLEGTWTLPAGKVMSGETLLDAAFRKVKEEVNLDILKENMEIVSIADDINEYAHFVTIGFFARMYSGAVNLGNTLEHTEYGYFTLDNLPDLLCEPSKKIIENWKENRIYKGE